LPSITSNNELHTEARRHGEGFENPLRVSVPPCEDFQTHLLVDVPMLSIVLTIVSPGFR
jgi:hypothetical protein